MSAKLPSCWPSVIGWSAFNECIFITPFLCSDYGQQRPFMNELQAKTTLKAKHVQSWPKNFCTDKYVPGWGRLAQTGKRPLCKFSFHRTSLDLQTPDFFKHDKNKFAFMFAIESSKHNVERSQNLEAKIEVTPLSKRVSNNLTWRNRPCKHYLSNTVPVV